MSNHSDYTEEYTEHCAEMVALQAEKLILLGEFNRLIGYVATCKATNTVDWMIGLEFRINAAAQAVGDPDRVRLIHAGNDWLFINREEGGSDE